MLERLNLRLMDILVMDDTESYRKQLQPQVDEGLELVRSSCGHVVLCTTFLILTELILRHSTLMQSTRSIAISHRAVAVRYGRTLGWKSRTEAANTSWQMIPSSSQSTKTLPATAKL